MLNAASSTGPAGLKYAWDLDNDGDFNDSTSATPTFTTVGDNGVFTVKVMVTGSNGDGFSAIATTTVTVTNVNADRQRDHHERAAAGGFAGHDQRDDHRSGLAGSADRDDQLGRRLGHGGAERVDGERRGPTRRSATAA